MKFEVLTTNLFARKPKLIPDSIVPTRKYENYLEIAEEILRNEQYLNILCNRVRVIQNTLWKSNYVKGFIKQQ